MIGLARLAVRRPLAALLCALIVGGGVTLIAVGIEDSLSPSVTTVPGTESSHAQHLAESEFGPSTLVPIRAPHPPSLQPAPRVAPPPRPTVGSAS